MGKRRVIAGYAFALLIIISGPGFGAVEVTSTNNATYSSCTDKFDWDLFGSVPAVRGIEELFFELEIDQNDLLPIAVPDANTPVRRSARKLLISKCDFPRTFLRGLVSVTIDGVRMHPVNVYEDAVTREHYVINAEGDEIAREPAIKDYDPFWFLYEKYDFLFDAAGIQALESKNNGSPSRNWYFAVYDPARIVGTYNLLYENDLIAWVTINSLAEEQQSAARSACSGGGTRSLGDPVTNLEFALIGGGETGITVMVTYPASYTSRVDIFYCTDFMAGDWSLGICTNISSVTNFIAWTDGDSISVGSTRFYHIGNADYDQDGDSLSDGREIYMYGTDNTSTNTDGDDVGDGEEILIYGTDPALVYNSLLPCTSGFDVVENFTNGALSGQQGWDADAESVVQSAVYQDGGQGTALEGVDSSITRYFATTNEIVTTELFVYLGPQFEPPGDLPSASALVSFDNSLGIIGYDGSGTGSWQVASGTTNLVNRWVALKIVQNYRTGYWNLYVDDVLKLQNLQFKDEIDQLRSLNLRSGVGGTIFCDEVSVY